MFLLNNGAPLCAENINEKRKTIHRLLGNTSNKKIIAVQMYKVKESHYKDGSTEKVRYDIQCNYSVISFFYTNREWANKKIINWCDSKRKRMFKQ